MTIQEPPDRVERKAAFHQATLWLWLSVVAAVLAVAGNVSALSLKNVYAGLTPAFLPLALAQDIVDLAVIAPAWLILAALALRGSLRAYLLWLGVLTFTVYNYVIYTFAVPFGPLYLLWIAVLGLCLYALIGGVVAADRLVVQASFTRQRAVTVTAWFLIVTAVLFGILWLSEDVPALLSGRTPQSLIDMALPTNPVHILDLAFFLPAVIAAGWLLLRQKPLAYVLAPGFLVFLILTAMPILLTPVVLAARGETTGWGVVAPIGTLAVAVLVLLTWLLATIRPHQRPA